MKPYQQRVIDEEQELDQRLTKLRLFIAESEEFHALSPGEQARMRLQAHMMDGY